MALILVLMLMIGLRFLLGDEETVNEVSASFGDLILPTISDKSSMAPHF